MKKTPDEVPRSSDYTRKGTERYPLASNIAETNKPERKNAYPVAKTNVLAYGHDLWRDFQESAKSIPTSKKTKPRRRLLHVKEPRNYT